jgi:hypothetical protein
MIVLFEHGNKRQYDDMRFRASLAGVDLDKALEKAPGHVSTPKDKGPKNQQNTFLFGDMSEYEHMSQEEKEELTQQMMGRHKAWGRNPMSAGGIAIPGAAQDPSFGA